VLSVVSNVSIDNKAHVMTSSISRSAGIVFGGAHEGRVSVRVFIGGECACV
jgi:hypothetical protein